MRERDGVFLASVYRNQDAGGLASPLWRQATRSPAFTAAWTIAGTSALFCTSDWAMFEPIRWHLAVLAALGLAAAAAYLLAQCRGPDAAVLPANAAPARRDSFPPLRIVRRRPLLSLSLAFATAWGALYVLVLNGLALTWLLDLAFLGGVTTTATAFSIKYFRRPVQHPLGWQSETQSR